MPAPISNGESGLSVRTKLNTVLARIPDAGTAQSSFLVSGATPFAWAEMTIENVKALLAAKRFAVATDPAADAAVTTAILDANDGVLITLTGAGNSQTLANPTTTTDVRYFTVINNDTSTHNAVAIANGISYTLGPGKGQRFVWDLTAWGPSDVGITQIPVIVTEGGTGRNTLTAGAIITGDGTNAVGQLSATAANDFAVGESDGSGGWRWAKKAIADVRDLVLYLRNNVFFKARNATNTADLDVYKVNASDELEYGVSQRIGPMAYDADAGAVVFINIPIVAAAAGVEQSYAFQIGSTTVAKIYGESNGAGGLQNPRVIFTSGEIDTPESITATSDGVAASLSTVGTHITTNGDEDLDNVTLADGTVGQIKQFAIKAVGHANDSVKITPATMVGGTQITFAASPIGLGCIMEYTSAGWVVIGNNGGTIA
jgi:hypothetical protein